MITVKLELTMEDEPGFERTLSLIRGLIGIETVEIVEDSYHEYNVDSTPFWEEDDMTQEEAIKQLKNLKEESESCLDKFSPWCVEEIKALDMAMEAIIKINDIKKLIQEYNENHISGTLNTEAEYVIELIEEALISQKKGENE